MNPLLILRITLSKPWYLIMCYTSLNTLPDLRYYILLLPSFILYILPYGYIPHNIMYSLGYF